MGLVAICPSLFVAILWFWGESIYSGIFTNVCKVPMAVTDPERIRSTNAAVEPTAADLEFDKKGQILLREIE